MSWTVVLTASAQRDLQRLDRPVAARILDALARPRRYQPRLDQSALLQTMRSRLHRAAGDAQALGDRGDFEPLVPECDEFRLGLQGVVLL